MPGYSQPGYTQPAFGYQLAPQYGGYGASSGLQTGIASTEVNTAISLGNGGYIGYGYGERHVAPAEIQAQYAGLPLTFFDASRGILFDASTQTAYFYAPVGSATVGNAVSRSSSAANLATAIEAAPSTCARITLGNGTSGNLEEHRNAIASFYLLDSRCQ